MSSVNKVILVGRLGQDPEARQSQGGLIVGFNLATSESWKDKSSGERREKTEWHRVVIFNENVGKFVSEYLKKGSRVYVEGQLQTRKWEDKNGQERYTTEVVVSKFRGDVVNLSEPREAAAPKPAQKQMSYSDELDDEVPF